MLDDGTQEGITAETPTPETPTIEAGASQEKPTVTAEGRVQTLESELAKLTKQLNESQQSYKGLQRVVTQKDADLKKQGDIDSRINGLQDTIELLATAIATGREPGDVEPQEKQNIVSLLKQQRQEQEARRARDVTQRTQQEYAAQADALWKEAQELFANDDNTLDSVLFSLSNGFVERAEARIAKARDKKATTQETEEQRIERLATERLNQKLKDKGLLETFESSPSGTADDQFLKRWGEGSEPDTPANKKRAAKLMTAKTGIDFGY